MLKYVVIGLLVLTISGLGYTLAAGTDDSCPVCENGAKVVTADASAPATTPATKPELVDVKNTKCIVTGEEAGPKTVEYNGKLYHICCSDCVDSFSKDPKKYVEALEKDPAKFGVPK